MQSEVPGNSLDVIHIALGIHDPQGDYSCNAGAMLASAFASTASSVCAHVIHNETLTDENKRKLQAIAQRFRKDVYFYPVQLPTEYHKLGGHVTQGALFRLLLPEVVKVEKVLYFDCDIVVTLDIVQLWSINLLDRPVAAVLDPGIPTFPAIIRQRIQSTGVPTEAYFNSGVMILNLERLRRDYQLFEQAIAYLGRYSDAVFHDQDALNFLFQQNFLQLDTKFNRIVSRTPSEEWHQLAVWHFAGVKPWLYYHSSLDMLYWKALSLTPWQGGVLDRLAGAISRTWIHFDEELKKKQQAYTDLAEQITAITGRRPDGY